jgi:uncharacterized protein (DUF952 family)
LGLYTGSEADRRDGFIHFSTAEQAPETARRHFAGRAGLLLVAFDAEQLGPALRWEPSRAGELFPHLYGPLPTEAAVEVRPLILAADGAPVPGTFA